MKLGLLVARPFQVNNLFIITAPHRIFISFFISLCKCKKSTDSYMSVLRLSIYTKWLYSSDMLFWLCLKILLWIESTCIIYTNSRLPGMNFFPFLKKPKNYLSKNKKAHALLEFFLCEMRNSFLFWNGLKESVNKHTRFINCMDISLTNRRRRLWGVNVTLYSFMGWSGVTVCGNRKTTKNNTPVFLRRCPTQSQGPFTSY